MNSPPIQIGEVGRPSTEMTRGLNLVHGGFAVSLFDICSCFQVVVDPEDELTVLLRVLYTEMLIFCGFEVRLEEFAGGADRLLGGGEIVFVAPADVAGGDLITDWSDVGCGEGEEEGEEDEGDAGNHFF